MFCLTILSNRSTYFEVRFTISCTIHICSLNLWRQSTNIDVSGWLLFVFFLALTLCTWSLIYCTTGEKGKLKAFLNPLRRNHRSITSSIFVSISHHDANCADLHSLLFSANIHDTEKWYIYRLLILVELVVKKCSSKVQLQTSKYLYCICKQITLQIVIALEIYCTLVLIRKAISLEKNK